jgi:putative flavoprotein involved in K+ transport
MAQQMTQFPTSRAAANERVEVAVIGAGQAGLAVSRCLTDRGHDHVVLERATRLAQQWRNRWDSFTVVTPNWSLRMPGFPYQGDDPDGFMPRENIVRYFEDYAASFNPPVRFGSEVTAVEPHPSGNGFSVTTGDGNLTADNVVVATGAYKQPNMPVAAARLPKGIFQLHSSQYRNPEALPPGAVLVVGTAQSGGQIAEELYLSGRRVYLSVGSAGRVPRRYRGKDVIAWLVPIGLFEQSYATAPEPKSRFEHPPHVSGKNGGRTLNLHRFARDGVQLLGHVQGAEDDTLDLAPDLHENLAKADGFAEFVTKAIDGYIMKAGLDAPPADDEPPLQDGFAADQLTQLDLSAAGITSVIWATGYRPDLGWVRFPVFDQYGFPVQQPAVASVPGLYFLGFGWPHTRKSATLFGVGDDAATVAESIASRAGVASC